MERFPLLTYPLPQGGLGLRADLEAERIVRSWDWPEVKGAEALGKEIEDFKSAVDRGIEAISTEVKLSAALGVERSSATRMCDRLVRKGLVHRRAGGELVTEVSRRRRADIVTIVERIPNAHRRPAFTLCWRSLRPPTRSPSRADRWDGICDR